MLSTSVSKLSVRNAFLTCAAMSFAIFCQAAEAQSSFQTAGSSYVNPLAGSNTSETTTAPAAGAESILNADRNSSTQFKSIVDIEKSNPYSGLSSPRARDTDGQYIGRANLSPDSLNSLAKPGGTYGNLYDARTVVNPYSQYGSTNSVSSAQNPYSAGSGPLLNSRDQRPTFPNYDQLGGGIQRWFP